MLEALRRGESEKRATLVNATASPYKFVSDVSEALGLAVTGHVFDDARALSLRTNTALPTSIAALETMEIRHKTVTGPEGMGNAVMAFIGKEA